MRQQKRKSSYNRRSVGKKKKNKIRALIVFCELLIIGLLVLAAYEMDNREKFHNIEVVEIAIISEYVA